MRKIISLLLCSCCCSSLITFSGCYFESEIFGSAAGSLKHDSASLVSSSISELSSSQESHSSEPDDSSETEPSADKEIENEKVPTSSQSSHVENSDELSESQADTDKKEPDDLPQISDHINSALTTLGFKERKDALALLLPAPLKAHFSAVSGLEFLSQTESAAPHLLFLPIYNNTTIEIYGFKLNDKDQSEQTLLYKKSDSPSGYGLAIPADAFEAFSDFRVSITHGDVSANYIIIKNHFISDSGEYFLNDSTFSHVDYTNDTIDVPTAKESLVSAVEYITEDFSSKYSWKYLSDKTMLLDVAEGDDPLSGEYYLEVSELLDGKGCCYYAVTLSRRTYDNGNAIGETIINRYLVTIPGNRIIPMFDQNGEINSEYNDIII